MKSIKFTFFLVFFALCTYGQTNPPVQSLTDKQIETFIQEAESRGLSEQQIETLARTRGYSDEDIALMRERIYQVQNNKTSTDTRAVAVDTRSQAGELSQRLILDSENIDSAEVEVFGMHIFREKNLNFEPNLRIATSPNYILGVEDEISVDITGYAYQHYDLRVSPEGTVKLESFAPIHVNGLTIRAAQERIKQQLSSIFSGLRDGSLSLDLTLTKVRSIQVSVVGEVALPGTYTLSSLASVFNALYLSGGPTHEGSFRNIQLLRNNNVIHTLDLYEFLTSGDLSGDLNLRDRDVIFVPTADRRVRITGEVVRPMQYELTASEGVDELIRYAGGYGMNAYRANIQLTRNTATEREVHDIDPVTFGNFLLRDGDEVSVGELIDRYTNRVTVEGAVFRPGHFAIGDGNRTVAQLIEKAGGLRGDAYKEHAILKRERENLDPEFLFLNLGRPLDDIFLQREDVLIIKSLTDTREARKVTISGSVNFPGEYDFAENMTMSDLILLAGGLKNEAIESQIDVARRLYDLNPTEKNVELFQLSAAEGRHFVLDPFDHITVRRLPSYLSQETVYIAGEVRYPGHYVIKARDERLSDLIERAGGVTPYAYLKGARVYRRGAPVATDLDEVMRYPDREINLMLEQGDSIRINKIPQTVELTGQVQNPALVAFQPNYSFRDYLSEAGGFTDSAHVKRTYVVYANGHSARTRSFLGIRFYPKVEKGMHVHVPTKNREPVAFRDIATVASTFVSLAVMVVTMIRVL